MLFLSYRYFYLSIPFPSSLLKVNTNIKKKKIISVSHLKGFASDKRKGGKKKRKGVSAVLGFISE